MALYHRSISNLMSLIILVYLLVQILVLWFQIKIIKAERDVYAAEIDEKVAVKIGPGHYEPPNGPKNWVLAAEGTDYKVWETS